MGRHTLVWAVGLFEGEGSITKCRPSTSNKSMKFILAMEMTDEDVVRNFGRVMKVGKVSGPYGPYGPNRIPHWNWRCSNRKEMKEVLTKFLPYLGLRRTAKAREALTWINGPHPKRGRPFSEASVNPKARDYARTYRLRKKGL